jgi:hypothetical protein
MKSNFKILKAILLLAICVVMIGLTLWGLQFAFNLFTECRDTFEATLIITSSIVLICLSGWSLTGLLQKIKEQIFNK